MSKTAEEKSSVELFFETKYTPPFDRRDKDTQRYDWFDMVEFAEAYAKQEMEKAITGINVNAIENRMIIKATTGELTHYQQLIEEVVKEVLESIKQKP